MCQAITSTVFLGLKKGVHKSEFSSKQQTVIKFADLQIQAMFYHITSLYHVDRNLWKNIQNVLTNIKKQHDSRGKTNITYKNQHRLYITGVNSTKYTKILDLQDAK